MRSAAVVEGWIEDGLHDLCQPLTALQCRLFLTTLGARCSEEELRVAIRESLVQCERMLTQVRAMQQRLDEEHETV